MDGNPNTLSSVVNFLNHKALAEFYTFDLGGTLPFERFMIRMPPPEVIDAFGRPFEQYVPQFGELTGSWHGDQIAAEINYGEDRAITNEFGEFRKEEYRPLEVFLGRVSENLAAPIDISFDLQFLRYVRWRTLNNNKGPGRVTHDFIGYGEFELYGRGFAHDSRFEVRVVDLGEPAILGRVHYGVSRWRRVNAGWEEVLDADGEVIDRHWRVGELVAASDAAAEAWMRIRTGSTDDPRSFFTYTDFGALTETDFETWNQLKLRALRIDPKMDGWQGPVAADLDGWTPWSGPIRSSGSTVSGASGRYLQLMAEFRSHKPADAARLDSARVELFPLLVPRLVGEIGLPGSDATLAQVPVGEPAEIVFAVRADFAGAAGPGFDALHIATPSEPELLGLRLGAANAEVAPEDLRTDSAGLTVLLPRTVDTDETLRIDMRTTFYTISERLEGAVFKRNESDRRQLISEGDAAADILTDRLTVIAEEDISDAIANLRIEPRTLTPNGDGSNDRVAISFTLYGLRDAEVSIAIFNLRGEALHRFAAKGQRAGVNAPVIWEGRDDSGRLLPPGLYLCQVETETSRGRFAETAPIAIAY